MTKNATYCDKHVSSRKCIFCSDGWCVHIPCTHNFPFVFVLCRYSCILVNLSTLRVDEMSSWEQQQFGITWIVLTIVLFAQWLRASLLLVSHTAMAIYHLCLSTSLTALHYSGSYVHFWVHVCLVVPVPRVLHIDGTILAYTTKKIHFCDDTGLSL